MTTDPAAPEDRAARIAALQQRRAAARTGQQAGEPDQARPAAPAGGPRPRARRRHAATGGRILAGSLSAAATLVLMGAMGNVAAGDAGSSASVPAPASATPTVIVIRRSADASAAATATVAPPIAATASKPVATSQAS